MQTAGGYQLQPDSPSPVNPSGLRSAILMWISGAILILASGCLASMFSVMSLMSLEDLRAAFPPEQVSVIETIYPSMIHLAVFFMAIGFVPGLLVVILAFGVMSSKTSATKWSFALVTFLTVIYGIILSLNVVSGVLMANIMAVLMNLIFIGGFVLLLAATVQSLYQLRTCGAPVSENLDAQTDPWNEEHDEA